ncbi:MAG: hypothetical protein KIS66_09600 [Fimbriimonadaceae bacterium]|nr:hypothetical protein [Fimbriimonadaceae bacterium]
MTTLILSAISVSSALGQGASDWAPPELRDGARFTLLREAAGVFTVERKSDGVRLHIVAMSARPETAKRQILPQAVVEFLDAVPYSGMPLGRYLFCPNRPGNFGITTAGDWEAIRLNIDSPLVRNGRDSSARPDGLASEGRWAEAIARKAFAAYASRRLGPAETISVNGRSVASRRAEKSNADMVDLGEWASAVGASLTRDPNGDAWTFVRGGALHTLALGADKVKVGGVWKPMPDAPMLKDGRVFVPRSALPN